MRFLRRQLQDNRGIRFGRRGVDLDRKHPTQRPVRFLVGGFTAFGRAWHHGFGKAGTHGLDFLSESGGFTFCRINCASRLRARPKLPLRLMASANWLVAMSW